MRSAVSACSSSCLLMAPAANSSLRALLLLPREGDVRLPRRALGLLARHRRLLAARIDLHQRRALRRRDRPTSRRSAVICPSICGWIVVECSDLSVATYSVASSMGLGCATGELDGGRRKALPALRRRLIAAATE